MNAKRIARFFLAATLAAAPFAAISGGCGSDCDLRIETEALAEGFVGVRYREHLDSDCGGDVWRVEQGNLPPGIQLMSDGDIDGTPTRAGTYDFTVRVVDVDGVNFEDFNDVAYKGLSITVHE